VIELVLSAAALGVVYYAIQRHRDGRISRALRAVPSRPLTELKDGQVGKIIGTVEPDGELLQAPFSGRACTYYLAIIEQRAAGRWRELARKEGGQDFYLVNGSARALVRMQAATVAAVREAKVLSTLLVEPPAELRAFLAGHTNLRYLERVIVPGGTVAVGGLVRWQPEQHAFLEASAQIPLFVSDDPAVIDT
jgi:hypothetical protein